MNMWRDVAVEDVKEPVFDRPEATETADLAISGGTRVVLSYHGKQLSAQVTAIERLGSSVVGRVLGFTPAADGDEDLAPGDIVRFRPRDVRWTE